MKFQFVVKKFHPKLWTPERIFLIYEGGYYAQWNDITTPLSKLPPLVQLKLLNLIGEKVDGAVFAPYGGLDLKWEPGKTSVSFSRPMCHTKKDWLVDLVGVIVELLIYEAFRNCLLAGKNSSR